MGNANSQSLTASELGYLWTGYSINEMSLWFLTVFQQHAQDQDVKNMYSYAIECTNELLAGRRRLLSNNGHSVPLGFSETDINLNSPPLFSDRFLSLYLYSGVQLGLEFHSRALAFSTREDVREYNQECLTSTTLLFNKVSEVVQSKSFYQRPPSLPPQNFPEKIQKTSYLNGWWGDSRPMNSMEMANLYLIMDVLLVMETLFMFFAQTSPSEDVKELMQKNVTVVKNQYHELAELLKKDNLPIPFTYAAEIKGSASPVFSERIMVCHLAGLFGSLISEYGFSLGTVMKHDLVKTYTTQIGKTGSQAEKISRFLIEKGWLEKVPGPN